jgi:hypothetical protein
MEIVSRTDAIRAIYEVFERHFGNDKGSGDAWMVFCEDLGFCSWDDEADDWADDNPVPSKQELFLAAGVAPQDIVDAMHINPDCFPDEMCLAYNHAPPQREGGEMMSDRLKEAIEKCISLLAYPSIKGSPEWSEARMYVQDITPVLCELCEEIERYKERHDGLWETIREFSAKDVKQREEIDRLTQHAAPLPEFPVSIDDFHEWRNTYGFKTGRELAIVTEAFDFIRTRYEQREEGE